MSINRRKLLKYLALGSVSGATIGVPLMHFTGRPTQKDGVPLGPQHRPKLGSWQDLYRQRWTWDKVAKGSHGWLNCRSACAWDIYVKNGVIVREEQTATYESSEPGIVPDFNPRGCQKGACYTHVMYGPSRLTVPLKRVGERGSRQWQKISWDQAIDEIAHKMVDTVQQHGTEAIYHDLGPHFDYGASTLARMKFFGQIGASIADDWAEIGDLNIGAMLTFGFPHMGGTSDEWFLSDCLVIWGMNPAVTQIPDAHFIFEARYNGASVTVIDPIYSATAVHADSWLPIRAGTDAALGLATARHIWATNRVNWAYVKEQTDLPMLVRQDTGRFLRESDVIAEGSEGVFYWYDLRQKKVVAAPAGEGSDNPRLFTEEVDPAVEGLFTVTLKDGETVQVAPVGALLKEQLDPWTFERAAQVTGLHVAQIREFAENFAKAERPLVLSSWGANRFYHSDLMNRTKILCLTLKGAIGKRGAGLNATGWFSLEGFECSAEMTSTGLTGMAGVWLAALGAKGVFEGAANLVMRKKTLLEITLDEALRGSRERVCGTNSASVNLNFQGIKDVLDAEALAAGYPRPVSEYDAEARAKGWMPTYPRPEKTPPKVWVTGGNNVLRRTNMPQHMLENMWPNLDLIVDINVKLSFTGMHADYLLPAAGYYEKTGIKYPIGYVPYLHFCDAAIPPMGESRDEWEIYWQLSKRVQEIAVERNVPSKQACGLATKQVDLKQLHNIFNSKNNWGPKDAAGVTQEILDISSSTMGMKIKDLKHTGIDKFNMTGSTMLQSQLFNGDWNGEGVLTVAQHQVKHKWRWPTLTGRQQFYIDHPWFIEANESLPAHKESPKAGGDLPFQMISCHSRWSVHSIWRDTPLLMRLQRGEPLLYLNPRDAERLGIADHDWAEIFNRLGKVHMRIKHSTMVRPGVAYYFHAWEPYQFPRHQSYKWITPGLMNPLHFAGGGGHVNWAFAMFQPGTQVQDTRIDIRPWAERNRQEQAARAEAHRA
ncbi:MAG TPA: hypothetical protein DF427_03960 [Moraxellaceae bacterium]|nr:hypothetical protein [Moraxellaceae bacterium]